MVQYAMHGLADITKFKGLGQQAKVLLSQVFDRLSICRTRHEDEPLAHFWILVDHLFIERDPVHHRHVDIGYNRSIIITGCHFECIRAISGNVYHSISAE